MYTLVGTLFIDAGDIYCFGTGLGYQCLKTYVNIAILCKTVNLHCCVLVWYISLPVGG